MLFHVKASFSDSIRSEELREDPVGIFRVEFQLADPIGIVAIPTLSSHRIQLLESDQKDSDNFRKTVTFFRLDLTVGSIFLQYFFLKYKMILEIYV